MQIISFLEHGNPWDTDQFFRFDRCTSNGRWVVNTNSTHERVPTALKNAVLPNATSLKIIGRYNSCWDAFLSLYDEISDNTANNWAILRDIWSEAGYEGKTTDAETATIIENFPLFQEEIKNYFQYYGGHDLDYTGISISFHFLKDEKNFSKEFPLHKKTVLDITHCPLSILNALYKLPQAIETIYWE